MTSRSRRPPLPDRDRPPRSWGWIARRALLIALVLAVGVLVFPQTRGANLYPYRIGQVAREPVAAPFDFPVLKDEIALERERDAAALAVPPVLAADPHVDDDALARFDIFRARVRDAHAEGSSATARRALLARLEPRLPSEAAICLARPARAESVLAEGGRLLQHFFSAGIVTDKRLAPYAGHTIVRLRSPRGEEASDLTGLYDLREVTNSARAGAAMVFEDDIQAAQTVAALVGAFARPNLLYDEFETGRRRAKARADVSLYTGEVKKGEPIVDAGDRVSATQLARLRSLDAMALATQGPASLFYPSAARLTLMLLFVVAFVIYLRYEQPQAYRNSGFLALCAVLAAVTMALAGVITQILGLPEYAVPVAFAPLILSILFSKRLALVYTLLLVVAISAVAEYRPAFVPVAAVGGIVAVYSVRQLRQRRHFYRALVYIALVEALAIGALGLGQAIPARMIARDVLAGIGGAAMSAFLAMIFLPMVEAIFRVPSDITLLELSDLNRPLLRRLMMEAPGTYHHSLVVGSLAESAAESIGANSLFARVAAYYHDIGKLSKPEYFTENEAGAGSRHARLTPSMSALVIKSHVHEGLELARREKLPPAIAAVIPEHHGSTVMAFFYAKALELDPATPDHDYKYPGPKPQSRETAIVMLADSIEGASRSLSNPTPARIRGLVNKIIDVRLHEGQLDECGLSLADLAKIRESFLQVLTGIFHVRVAYPELPGRIRDADLAREGKRF